MAESLLIQYNLIIFYAQNVYMRIYSKSFKHVFLQFNSKTVNRFIADEY